MSKRRKAKKTPPVKRRRMTFRITVEAQEMVVSYERRWRKSGYAHFEFRSPHKPARRIPVSETGYLGHFATSEEISQAGSPRDLARGFVTAYLQSKQSRPSDPRQLALFQ
jgi:hypothetical protein